MSSSVQLEAKAPSEIHFEVEGIGPVTLPVSADHARWLRALGRPAHFGRGEETLTDSAVRDTWQVPTELVRVEWAGGAGLEPELEVVRERLGLPEHCRLTAELHSLLVYEEGQFFLPHQDSEKDDVMVATLVVTLPSAHTGGELVVHHLGEATVYRGSQTHVSLVAFYADCRHEVRPVTSGDRVTLTYNLFLQGDSADRVPDETTVRELARYVGEHLAAPYRRPYGSTTSGLPHRLVFLLDHEYTERSLSWPLLKGADAQRVSLVRAAADVAGYEAVLALTEINETWDVESENGDWARGYQDWTAPWADQEDEVEDEADDAEYQLRDLLHSSIRLTRWTDPEGTSAENISLNVADSEVYAATPSFDLRPYESKYEGYMGNYGNTLDRWYRRAAVVMWPREQGFTVRAEASPSWAMDDLIAQIREGDSTSARGPVATLAPFWGTAVRKLEKPGGLLAKTLRAALALDDADLASMLLHPFTIENLSRGHTASLAKLTGRYGEEWTNGLVRGWFEGGPVHPSVHSAPRPQWFTSLPALCDSLLAKGTRGASVAHLLLELAWTRLALLIGSALERESVSDRRQQLDDLGKPLAGLIRAVVTSQATNLRDRITDLCRKQDDAMSNCVIPALRAASGFPAQTRQDDAFEQLAADQATRLGARLARPTRAADDWSIELPDGCACDLCGTLGSFLANPAQQTLEWVLAQDRRSHVQYRIDQAELPVRHLIRHQGRPYTLVLAKTAQLFEREMQQRAQNQADLGWLLRHWGVRSTNQLGQDR
jgi:hypothetical protein